MLEEHVAFYLQKYLGNYVKGLSKEALKISVWQGNVELTNMQLKPEALNALKLPIKVKAGFLGSVKLKVPWNRLGKEPVLVLLDRIFVLAEPETKVECGGDESTREAKRRKVKDAESAMLEAKNTDTDKSEVNNSWLGSLISTIIGNLKLSITNVHIRYEDSESNPGQPFAAGLTLEKLAAVTVDENGKETFISGGALDQIQKAGELQGLALYLDPGSGPWKSKEPWDKLPPSDWSKIFEPSIKVQPASNDGVSEHLLMPKCHYLLQPVSGTARYTKLGAEVSRTADKEVQKAVVSLDDVTLSLSQAQYRDILKSVENLSAFKKRTQYAQYRPAGAVKGDAKSWWQYAFNAMNEEHRKTRGHLSWEKLLRFTRSRKKYVPLYVNCLQSNPNITTVDDNKEILELEDELDADIIIQWRMLAHKYVDQNRKEDMKRNQQQSKGNWLGFLWNNQSSDDVSEQKSFSEEDWNQLNQVIGYEEGVQSTLLPGQDPPDMLHTILEVHMRHNATKLVDENGCNIVELSAENLECIAKLYPEMKVLNVKLGSYQLPSPEGLLAESEARQNAISGEFIYMPLDKSVDWSLSARASPCYITYLKASVNEVMEFFQNSSAVSQTVVLETAAALQAKLDEVAKSAQQQLNEALKQKPRFSLDLDIAAPKIVIPSEFYPDSVNQSKLLLDFGYLTLQTEKPSGSESQEETDLYMHFKLGLSDVQIFLSDGEFDWRKHSNVSSSSSPKSKLPDKMTVLPVLERGGITVALQQICVPHPGFPSTRVAVRLPSLGFHFSPARYHRLMQIFKVFQSSSTDESEKSVRPWDPADFEEEISILAWKGVGNREAVWQHRYAALAGAFLYILEVPTASTCKRRISLIGKQVLLVPPESIGGEINVLAVCDAGQNTSKVAESLNAVLLRIDNEDTKELWKGRLQGAIYRFSPPAAVSGMLAAQESEQDPGKDASDGSQENPFVTAAEKENLFLIGALDELKIVISSGPGGKNSSKEQLLLESEHPLLELRALGTKVEFIMRKFDMSVGAVLQALDIEDKFSSKGKSQRRYLACSDLQPLKTHEDLDNHHNFTVGNINAKKLRKGKGLKDRNLSLEKFFDTDESWSETENSHEVSQTRHLSRSTSDFYDAEDLGSWGGNSAKEPPKFEHTPGLLPDLKDPEKEGLKKNEVQEDFVKAQVILFTSDSPAYKNADKQITVALATFSFFCIRPTIMALLDFTAAINADVTSTPQESPSDKETPIPSEDAVNTDNDTNEPHGSFDRKDSVVKGLLGSGKDRILFSLSLNMHQAVIILNSDDGSQFATLAQEDLHCAIKVFPSSFGIAASLGNLKVTDGSLESDNPYSFICDTRNPGSSSFIELEFVSFNEDDNDYEGYEYCLVGKFSELRFVFLYRFIQELSAYFMGLVPKSSGYVVKLDNKVMDVEKFFTQSEVEGSPGIKLDISLTKPIIIMPRETYSKDFLELDILQVNVKNSIEWINGEKQNPGALRLDTTDLNIEDIHLSVGMSGKSGEGIIKKANGLSLKVVRPLRDLWHQVPGVEASIKIDELKADLSDKEYQVITECASSNISEKPNLPPPVILPNTDRNREENDSESEKEDKADSEQNLNEMESKKEENQASSSDNEQGERWTTIMVSAAIELVELSIFKGRARELALATTQVSGVWVAFTTNSIQESHVMVSLETFSVKDDREGIEPELRFMIGKADNVDYHVMDRTTSIIEAATDTTHSVSVDRTDCRSPLTMLVMDAKLSSDTQMVSLRVQQPRLLVAVDFLLAVADFFVPSIHTIGSDPKDTDQDLSDLKAGLYLDKPVYKQQSKEMTISPQKPLIADSFSVDDYIYDGKGGSIQLLNGKGRELDGIPAEPLIFVGNGKRLQFRNVVIKSGHFLDSCIFLGINSSYSIRRADGVFLEPLSEKEADEASSSDKTSEDEGPQQDQDSPLKETVFDLQAIGPELTFYDSLDASNMPNITEKLVRAKLDVFSRFFMKGDDMELNAKLNGLSVEAGSGLNILEPVDTTVQYSKVSGKQNAQIFVSDILTNISFSALQLIMRLQEDISLFLQITTKQATIQCYQFDRIWTDESRADQQCLTFWRPRAPPGFVILGDCITPSDEPLAKGALALNMSLSRVRRPVGFEMVWSSDEYQNCENHKKCCVWLPIPPAGYVALGCMVTEGEDVPPTTAVVCILERVVTLCSMKDSILVPGAKTWAFWRVENSVSSFFVVNGLKDPSKHKPLELRHIVTSQGFPKAQSAPPTETPQLSTPSEHSEDENIEGNFRQDQSERSRSLVTGSLCDTVACFKLVWWDKSDRSRGKISIWRPIVPAGCFFVGDLAMEGYEPPSLGLVLHNQHDGLLLKKPLYFQEQGRLKKQRTVEALSFWLPVAPPGYAALGSIATESDGIDPDLAASVRCIRNDLLTQTQFRNKLWDNARMRHSDGIISLWPVENELHTFIVHKAASSKYPPQRLALGLADQKRASNPDNLVVAAEVKAVSVLIYDDFRGFMVPLLNLSLLGLNASSHGRTDALCSTVNFSFTAVTYNGRHYAWEPLIEPLDGFVRHDYKSSSSGTGVSGTESQIRIISTSKVNFNISVSNLNMLLEAYASWNNLSELMEKSKSNIVDGQGSNVRIKPALELSQKRSFQVVHHNKLGEDLLIRVMDFSGQPKVVPLPANSTASLDLPILSSILNPSLKGDAKRQPLRLVAIRIGDAELPYDGGLQSLKFMATIRIVPRSQTSDQGQLEQQSARSRCVTPDINSVEGKILVEWGEVFIFETEPEEVNVAEMMVINLATETTVGYFSFSLSGEDGKQSNKAGQGSESRPLCAFEMKWNELLPRDGCKDKAPDSYCGKISYGVFFFPSLHQQEISEKNQNEGLKPGIIQVSYKNHECWADIGLNYGASATCWRLGDDTIATETVVKDGQKELIFRSLVVVFNSTDFPLLVALSLKSVNGNTSDSDEQEAHRHISETVVDDNSKQLQSGSRNKSFAEPGDIKNGSHAIHTTEEIFENERFQPVIGWGSTWPGHFLPRDPKHWSKRDYSSSVQEFPEAQLPLGWEWTENWKVDKAGAADEEGWSYFFSFKSTEWPPLENIQSPTKFVRRRRWVRSRKSNGTCTTNPALIGTLKPGESIPLPIASLRKDSPNYSLQIRPYDTEASDQSFYRWSSMVLCKQQSESRRKSQSLSQVSVNSLSEEEELLFCSKEESASSTQTKIVWLCLDVQAKEIGMNSQLDPLKDWRLVVAAPLVLLNFLPVTSEYSVLEKCPGRGLIERERGVVGPGDEAQVFHADIRRPLYLTWIPQGGWKPEEDPALISHPYKQSTRQILLKSFRTERTLRILMDQCQDGKELVAKRLRFYVPCWLDVEKCPPVHCKLVEIKHQRKLKEDVESKLVELILHEEITKPYTMVSTFNVEKMGVSVASAESEKEQFAAPTSLDSLGQADGSVELRSLDEAGSSYNRILMSAKLCPYPSVPTKIVVLRPYITFTNRVGETVYMRQEGSNDTKVLNPSSWRSSFPIQVHDPESMQIRISSTQWSLPFIIREEETVHIALRKDSTERRFIRVEIRGFEEGSRFLVVFRKGSSQGPYRLENRTKHIEIQYRQSGLDDAAWQCLQPCSASLYAWEDPCGEKRLEVSLVKDRISTTEVFDIQRVGDHYPSQTGSSAGFCCQVLEAGTTKVVKFLEVHEKELQTTQGNEFSGKTTGSSKSLSAESHEPSSPSRMGIQVELGRVGLSVIDLKAREILFLSIEKLSFSYAMGYAGKTRRIELLIDYLQLDNQLSLAIFPVLLVPEERHSPVLKFTIIISDEKAEATEIYPYIGVRVTKSAWRINIYEPIIWAVMDFYNDLHLDKLSGGTNVGQVDPEVRIDLIDTSEVRLKLTLETASRQRPRGVLGMWGPVVNTLGNISKMPIHLRSVVHTKRYMRKSATSPAIVDRLRRDLIHNPIMLLTGVDVIGMTSSTISTLSETVAGLSSDAKFLQLRSKLDRSRRISGVSDGLVQGTEAIAQGVAFGVSGVIRKPLEKAKENGIVGFIEGLGKAVLGVIVQPMSGVLDFVALTVNGVGASCTKCLEIFEREPSFQRVRHPRAIRPDGVLCCYDEKAAAGQAILQLAEGKGRFRQGVFFREPSKFAWSDFYVDHYYVMNRKIVMITNKRALLLQSSKSFKEDRVQKEPCYILWDVPWGDLLSLELACTVNNQSPIYLVFHLCNASTSFAQVIKCSLKDSDGGIMQAKSILEFILKSWKAYGPNSGTVSAQVATKRHRKISSAPSTSNRPLQSGFRPTECSENQIDLPSGSSGQNASAVTQGRQIGDTIEVLNFDEVWSSERKPISHCVLCADMVSSVDNAITIWRPVVPEGYACVGDIAHIGKHPPLISICYKIDGSLFSRPTGFDLVWRSWQEGFLDPLSIWMPRAPDGYSALGCVAIAALVEPEVDCVWCVHSSLLEDAEFEEQEVWHAPNNASWGCFLYQIASEALTFMAFRQAQQQFHWKPKKISHRDNPK